MWNRKIEKTQHETLFVKCQTNVNRKPEIRHQNAENENRQVDKWIIETWILKVPKIWKSKLGIANHKIEEMIKLKSNKRQSGMGIENRKTENPKMCICCCFPKVFRFFLHPSSDFAVRFKLNNLSKFNLFSVVVFIVFFCCWFRFGFQICFVVLFSFCDKTLFY